MLKAPDWYVTVAVSDSSPLKCGGVEGWAVVVDGWRGEGLIHLIRALLDT